MKHVHQLLLPVLAAVLLLAGCASFEFNSGEKTTQLREGMTYSEVVTLLGEPASSQLAQGRLMVRWSLHVMWKGFVPYDLEFNAKTRRLIAWKANEAEYQKSQQQMATTFGVSANIPGGSGSQNPTVSGNSAEWSKELLGRELVRISSGTGNYSSKTLFLCRNGTYRTSSDSGNFGGGAFSSARSGASGSWQASGPANAGLLILKANNGSQQQYRVNISEEGLYLDGTKWLRGDDSGC